MNIEGYIAVQHAVDSREKLAGVHIAIHTMTLTDKQMHEVLFLFTTLESIPAVTDRAVGGILPRPLIFHCFWMPHT